MVDAKELMIGNYVECISSGRIFKVDDIGDTGVNIQWMHEMTSYEFDFKDINPIPLTEDVLVKCGFKFSVNKTHGEHYSITQRKGCKISIYKNSWYAAAVKDNPFHVFYNGVEIKSLHQLQNLYLALTGQELDINF